LNGFYFPILGAVALATGIVIQRTILKKEKSTSSFFNQQNFLPSQYLFYHLFIFSGS